jgi:plasmid stability protein
MSTVLVRDLKEESLARLMARAATHGMGLESELQAILETAADTVDMKPWSRMKSAPMPKAEDTELDSVGQLELYMSTCWPNARG